MGVTAEIKAAMKAAAEKATPGDWFASGVTRKFEGVSFMFVNVEPMGEICRLPQPDRPGKGYSPTICDQHHIALANPANVLALLAEKEALAARVAELETVVRHAFSCIAYPVSTSIDRRGYSLHHLTERLDYAAKVLDIALKGATHDHD